MRSWVLVSLCLLISLAHADSGTDSPVTVNQAFLGSRARYITDSKGAVINENVQEAVVLDVTLDIYKEGDKKYVQVNLQTATGAKYDTVYNYTGIGPHAADKQLALRRVSLTLRPLAGLDVKAISNAEVTAGSMAPEYGAGTDNTGPHHDGWIMGYRGKGVLNLLETGQTEVVVTGGFLGDYNSPQVFDRTGRIADFNYLQTAITQSIAAILTASVEYDQHWKQGAKQDLTDNFARVAVKVDVSKWTNFLSALVVEDLAKVSSADPINDFAVSAIANFKNLFGEEKDLKATLSYVYLTKLFEFPVNDHIAQGHQARLRVEAPKLFLNYFGLYADLVKNISHVDQGWLEAGLFFKY